MISLQLESEVIRAVHTCNEQSKDRKDQSRNERNTKHKSKVSDVDPQLTDGSAPGELIPGGERDGHRMRRKTRKLLRPEERKEGLMVLCLQMWEKSWNF